MKSQYLIENKTIDFILFASYEFYLDFSLAWSKYQLKKKKC